MAPTRKDHHAAGQRDGDPLVHRSVTDVQGLDELFEGCFPSFGGGYLRRICEQVHAYGDVGPPERP